MNALDELRKRKDHAPNSITELEWTILLAGDELAIETRRKAAAELAALLREREALRTHIKTISVELDATSDFRMLDGSPCWCGRTGKHSLTCTTRRTAL